MINEPRYEIRTGKFGQYFFDSDNDEDMSLAEVLYVLNTAEKNVYEARSKAAKMTAELEIEIQRLKKEGTCKPHLYVGWPPHCTRCGELDVVAMDLRRAQSTIDALSKDSISLADIHVDLKPLALKMLEHMKRREWADASRVGAQLIAVML